MTKYSHEEGFVTIKKEGDEPTPKSQELAQFTLRIDSNIIEHTR